MQTWAKATTGHKHATTSVAASKAQKKTWGNDSDIGGRKMVSKWGLKYVFFFVYNFIL